MKLGGLRVLVKAGALLCLAGPLASVSAAQPPVPPPDPVPAASAPPIAVPASLTMPSAPLPPSTPYTGSAVPSAGTAATSATNNAKGGGLRQRLANRRAQRGRLMDRFKGMFQGGS
jgi:hypothetical protein